MRVRLVGLDGWPKLKARCSVGTRRIWGLLGADETFMAVQGTRICASQAVSEAGLCPRCASVGETKFCSSEDVIVAGDDPGVGSVTVIVFVIVVGST